MTKGLLLTKIAAVVSSVLLASGYVLLRGGVMPGPRPVPAAAEEPQPAAVAEPTPPDLSLNRESLTRRLPRALRPEERQAMMSSSKSGAV